MDFDPVSGNLWDTENGPGNGDEINLVLPGFNSGWQQVQGLASMEDSFSESDLQTFEGKGHYSDPELVWINTAGPTAVKFLESTELGTTYENDMFVGDIINGTIYRFELNENRSAFVLEGALDDTIANTPEEAFLTTIENIFTSPELIEHTKFISFIFPPFD